MASVDPRIIEQIARARLAGRGPDSVAPHNPDWPPYKMYPEIYDAMDEETPDAYNLDPPPPRQHQFGGPYAQYQGQPESPDFPSARDVRTFERSNDPEMRRRFEEAFGTEAVDRENRNLYGTRSSSYVPTPRPRPPGAPEMTDIGDKYMDPLPPQMPPFESRGQSPEEVYGYMPSLRGRVEEQLLGEGPSRNLKSGRWDGNMWDRAMAPFAGDPRGNIEDYRMLAIEKMLREGARANPSPMDEPTDAIPLEELPPARPRDFDQEIQRQLEQWRR